MVNNIRSIIYLNREVTKVTDSFYDPLGNKCKIKDGKVEDATFPFKVNQNFCAIKMSTNFEGIIMDDEKKFSMATDKFTPEKKTLLNIHLRQSGKIVNFWSY